MPRVQAYEAHSSEEIKLHGNIHDFYILPPPLPPTYLKHNCERTLVWTCVLGVRRKAAER
jgi:hypothetical protein